MRHVLYKGRLYKYEGTCAQVLAMNYEAFLYKQAVGLVWFIFFLLHSELKLVIASGLKDSVYLEHLKYVITLQICVVSGYSKSVPRSQAPLPGITLVGVHGWLYCVNTAHHITPTQREKKPNPHARF